MTTQSGPASADEPVVSLRNVSRNYGTHVALRDTNLDVFSGEVVTLLGPSGSGKTTLLRMVAGFLEPTGGTVLLRGRDVTNVPPQKRNTAMVFQNYALFPHMTVSQNLAFGLQMRKLSRQVIADKVEDALRLIQLDGYGERLPRQLSGGQQQRVALMRALITEPDVLLMDEPLGALDRKLREELQIEIKSFLNRMQITTIYVTHDQEEALVLSDRIAIINGGRIEQLDSPGRVYHEPATPFVAQFIGTSNLLAATVTGVDGEHCEITTDKGWVIRSLGRYPLGSTVHAVLRPERLQLMLSDTASEQMNVVAGVIAHVRHLGDVDRYAVETGHGHLLEVTQLAQEEAELVFSEGTRVQVEFGVHAPKLLERPADTQPDNAREHASQPLNGA